MVLPYNLYQEHGIRRYGFHGTSHYFVANQAAQKLNKPLSECNLISAHLGNGCSVTVIKNGKKRRYKFRHDTSRRRDDGHTQRRC